HQESIVSPEQNLLIALAAEVSPKLRSLQEGICAIARRTIRMSNVENTAVGDSRFGFDFAIPLQSVEIRLHQRHRQVPRPARRIMPSVAAQLRLPSRKHEEVDGVEAAAD